jgi:hypothetical protein
MIKATGRRRGFKSWFVEPYRQVKLGLLFLVTNLVFSALILGVFGYYVWDMYSAVSSYFHLTQEQSSLALAKFSTPMIVGSGLIVVFVITTIMLSVKYTHQIYGPLISIHRFLDQMLAGEKPESLQLRESDQLQDLAEKLNTIAEVSATDKRQGPMIGVYRFLDELNADKMPAPLKFRDTDQISQLAEKLNTLAAKIHGQP